MAYSGGGSCAGFDDSWRACWRINRKGDLISDIFYRAGDNEHAMNLILEEFEHWLHDNAALKTRWQVERPAIPQQLKDAIALMLRYANRCFEGSDYDKFIELLRVVEQRASV